MILDVVKYGHPALRQKGAKITQITPEIQTLIRDMMETMYAAKGVGLAAQQVARALQLTVIDVKDVADRPSWMEMEGKAVSLHDHMPLALINPQVTPVGEKVEGVEGCLSFPEIYTDISRPESVDVIAQKADGSQITFRCGGLLARAVQHEVDHLNGILFIDRMTKADKEEFQPELNQLQSETKAALKKKK